MSVKDCVDEYKLDWITTPVRTYRNKYKELSGKRVVIIGDDNSLSDALFYSFLAINDYTDCKVDVVHEQKPNRVEKAEIIIYTGRSNQVNIEITSALAYTDEVCKMVERVKPEKFMVISDYRVYGKTSTGISMSENECGILNDEMKDALAINKIENKCRAHKGIILRAGEIYGPRVSFDNKIYDLANAVKTKGSDRFTNFTSSARVSYVYIGDLLSAVHFMLISSPRDLVFNVTTEDNTVNDLELFSMLSNPEDDILLNALECRGAQTDRRLHCEMNAKRLEHAGWKGTMPLCDGLEIIIRSICNKGEPFYFRNAYQGKIQDIRNLLLNTVSEVDKICRKHNIKYSLGGGSLLGAVRHGGFIPWDDDLDLMMSRDNYEKFCKVANELPKWLFWQSVDTEKNNHFFSKVRILGTEVRTAFAGKFDELNKGLFVDIFSHDLTANSKLGQKLHRNITKVTRSMVYNKWGHTSIESDGSHLVIRGIFTIVKNILPMSILQAMQFKAIRFFEGNSKKKYMYDGMGQNLKRGAFPKEWLDETEYVDFDGIKLPIIKEYDKYLKFLYGDYMEMIPVSERKMSHDMLMLDLGKYAGKN